MIKQQLIRIVLAVVLFAGAGSLAVKSTKQSPVIPYSRIQTTQVRTEQKVAFCCNGGHFVEMVGDNNGEAIKAAARSF